MGKAKVMKTGLEIHFISKTGKVYPEMGKNSVQIQFSDDFFR